MPDASFYFDRALNYERVDDYENAIQDYDRAIQLDPNFATAYNNRSDAYYNLGKYAEADADKAKACSLDANYC